MRFGLIHRLLVDTLAMLGILAVVSSATLAPWAAGLAVLGGLAALCIPEHWQQQPWARSASTFAPVVLLCIEAVRLFTAGAILEVAIEFAVLLQVVRLATRRGASHDQQIVVLALLHFVVGTVLGGGVAFGLCFLGFVIVAPGALVLSHLRREVEGNYRQGARDRTGLPVDVPRILRSRRVIGRGFLFTTTLMSIPIFAFTALLFMAFPRVGLSLLLVNQGRGGRMVGFSDRVDLGEVGTLRMDPAIALRFEPENLSETPPLRITLRLRGTAFDTYDGHAWSRSKNERAAAERLADTFPIIRYPNSRDTRLRIDLEPIDPPVLFLPPHTAAVEVTTQLQQLSGNEFALQRGPEGEVRYANSETRGLHYRVHIAPETEPAVVTALPPADRARYLGLPRDTSEALAKLAAEWTADAATPAAKARAIEAHLKQEFTYDTASPSGGKPHPVEHFLFESHRGHCEFFSTAMALMLRTVDIPSRNTTGFVGGTYNRFGKYYAVREGDAHSWVEAFMESRSGVGVWTTFDPTPTAAAQPLGTAMGSWAYVRDLAEAVSQRWNRNVIGYDLQQQSRVVDAGARRFRLARQALGVDHGSLERLTRADALALYMLLAAVGVYLYWRRRKRPQTPAALKAAGHPIAHVADATMLYRNLEAALAACGFKRAPEQAPLRHAHEVAKRAPELAEAVLLAVRCYLDVRFGNHELTAERVTALESATATLRNRLASRPPTARA